MKEEASKSFVTERLAKAGFRNIDAFLEAIIFDKPVAVIVVIDKATDDLENVLAHLNMGADVLEFKTFVDGGEQIHYFKPFQQEIREPGPGISPEEYDTTVVPAREEGFNGVFLGEDCWYAIVISASMIDRIKYIAGYQVAPISAITHYAEVSNIEKYKDTNKYIVYFKDKAKEIGPVRLPKKSKGLVPFAPRYTSFRKLDKAKTLKDIF